LWDCERDYCIMLCGGDLLWDCERDYCIVLCEVMYCGTVRETTV